MSHIVMVRPQNPMGPISIWYIWNMQPLTCRRHCYNLATYYVRYYAEAVHPPLQFLARAPRLHDETTPRLGVVISSPSEGHFTHKSMTHYSLIYL